MGWLENTVHGRRILEHNGIISTYSADTVLLPDEEIGIAILYNISSFPTNTFGSPQIRNGLISLLTGKQPESSWMNVRLWGWITGLFNFDWRISRNPQPTTFAALGSDLRHQATSVAFAQYRVDICPRDDVIEHPFPHRQVRYCLTCSRSSSILST